MLKELTLSEIADICGGTLVGNDAVVQDVVTDTRGSLKQCLFVALVGDHFDGHDFASVAIESGATAALVSKSIESTPYVLVNDTRAALSSIAHFQRSQFKGQVTAITGSNGKTSVKDWLANVLDNVCPTLRTQANLNNQIGVPKTLLQLNRTHGVAVIEAGTSFPGEIPILGKAIEADVVVLTNASGSHLAGFGSTKGIAEEKGALITTAKPDARVVLFHDDPHFDYWCSIAGERKVLSFSFRSGSDATLICEDLECHADHSKIRLSFKGNSFQLRVNRPGRHHVANAMAVCLAMYAQGYDLDTFLPYLSVPAQVPGRMESLTTKTGALLVNDCYNASPKSVEAAIDVLALQSGETWLVLGALGELGDLESQIHHDLGVYAGEKGIQHLVTLGPIAGIAAKAFQTVSAKGIAHPCDAKADIVALLSGLDQQNAILVKGSRSAKMEDIVHPLVCQETN